MSFLFRINGIPVLHFFDLKRNFNPWSILHQADAFVDFARVHCVPVRQYLTDADTGTAYQAEYLTKQFWLERLCTDGPETGGTALCQLQRLLEQLADEACVKNKACDRDTLLRSCQKEMADARIVEKIDFISGQQKTDVSGDTILRLLAVAMLAEVEPKAIDASLWKDAQNPAEDAPPEIFPFPDVEELYLPPGEQAYRYWYHDSEELAAGSRIRTVRITAQKSAVPYAAVRIELYSRRTEDCVYSIDLHQEEYRYVTVADGQVIKFLPTLSVGDDMLLCRKPATSRTITVACGRAEPWELKADEVSSFAAGSPDTGFLLVAGGRLIVDFFKPAEDHFYRLAMELLPLPVVEAEIVGGRYQLLLEDGTVVSGASSVATPPIVSLSPNGRCPLPVIEGMRTKEVVLSAGGSRVAAICDTDGEDLFCPAPGGFTVKKDDRGAAVVLLKREGR